MTQLLGDCKAPLACLTRPIDEGRQEVSQKLGIGSIIGPRRITTTDLSGQ
jgi:hypothetical protein